MSIFNSLGSNYNLKFATQTLFSKNKATKTVQLKSYLDNKYRGKTILLYKGREALELALNILDFPDTAYVAINGYTCYAVYKAVLNAKYKIQYIDIAESDLNFSPSDLEEKLRSNPLIKVVVIQNTLGYSCNIEKIATICKRENIILIEDLAHSVGTTYENGSEAGTVGDFVILSFSQDKIIDGVSGGALIIRNERFRNVDKENFSRVNTGRQYRDKFYPLLTLIIRKTHSLGIGKVIHALLKKVGLLSMPMSDLNSNTLHNLPSWYCSLIYDQFISLENELKHRRNIAKIYADNLNPEYLQLNTTNKKIKISTNLRFPLLVKNRNGLIDYLRKDQIFISDIWYDAPIAPKKYMNLVNYNNECHRSERTSEEMLNLPTHKNISAEQAKLMAKKINIWLQSQ